jgi:hypothetical protein
VTVTEQLELRLVSNTVTLICAAESNEDSVAYKASLDKVNTLRLVKGHIREYIGAIDEHLH